MSTQHTPGPWEVGKIAALIIAPDDESICLMRWPTTVRTEVETKANAHLIAAAPELLDALEMMMDGGLEGPTSQAIERARAAIAKAKGVTL